MAVVWINASSPVSVMQSYKAVAKKILKNQEGDTNSENVISLIQDTLRDWKHPWLFVFDNYDNPSAFQSPSIRDYIPSGGNGRILFTSRHEDSARLGHKIEVSGMTENESLQVLLRRVPLNDEELLHGKKVASTLGYLALALDQAGSYLRARNLRLRDFISHYHKRKEAIWQAIPDEWEYRRVINDEEKETNLRIFTTWELSFEQINGHEKEIQQKDHFLSLAAFFDITIISERYFEAYFKAAKPEWMIIFSSENAWDGYKLGDVLAEFNKLSLLQKSEQALNGQIFAIHPVVRDWIQIRKSRGARQQFAEEFITTLESYLQNVDNDNLTLETKQETLLHIDSCVRSNKDLLSGSSRWSLDDHPSAASWFAGFYRDQGRYNEAEKLYERALTGNEEKLGATHPDTLRTVVNLAIVYRNQGRYDEAEKLYERALTGNEEKLGATHPDTLRTVENLANVYRNQGRYDEAEKLYERALTGREEKLGATHPDTLGTVENLAIVYSSQGRYDEAEKLYERALTGNEEKLGATHPDTLRTVVNLAIVYRNQGRYDEAEKLYERALTGREEKLGATHPDTLGTVENLAIVYSSQGRYDEAEKLYERALTGNEEKLGATHPDTLRTVENLANVYRNQGRYDEAEKLYERALTGNEEKLGATHPDTLGTVENLAIVYSSQGRYDEAEKLYERALTGNEEKLGATHPDTLRTVVNLAIVYRNQGRYDEAEKLYERALTGREEKLGATHSDRISRSRSIRRGGEAV